MIYPLRTIVAGIAELDGPDPVLASAAELAARTGATLHLVHAFELPDLMWDTYARMGFADVAVLRQFTASMQAHLEAAARAAGPDARVRCHAVAGPSAPMIQALARQEEADLIVVGATRRGALARAILGTTAQRVLREAPAPVLVLRRRLPERPRRVLMGTDLSDFGAGIHEIGLDVLDTLFGPERPELRSLFVLGYAVELPPPLNADLLERTATRQLEEFLRERRERGWPVAARVRVGDPAREIVAEAAEWGADLLVLGTHGRTGARRWLLGSVAEAAVRGAAANVLVIPARLEEQRILPVPAAGGAAGGRRG